jgi:nitrate/nitrite transporter NarK
MMAVTFVLLAFVPNLEKLAVPFLVIYGLSFFFTEFGPNSTTFVYPSEIFPVRVRTTGHGIAAAMGKLGGFAGFSYSRISSTGRDCSGRNRLPPP